MKKKKRKKEEKTSFLGDISDEVKQYVLSVIFFAISILFVFSPFGKAGIVGDSLYSGLSKLLGYGYYILPILFLLLSLSYLRRDEERTMATPTVIGSFLFLLSALGIIELLIQSGGLVGKAVAIPMMKMFDFTISLIFLFLFFVISVVLIFNRTPKKEKLFFWRRFGAKKEKTDEEVDMPIETETDEEDVEQDDEKDADTGEDAENTSDEKDNSPKKSAGEKIKDIFSLDRNDSATLLDSIVTDMPFIPPPLSLLSKDSGKPGAGDTKANSNIIKRALQTFGINIEMADISVGPSVTRYAMKPAEGVKLSRIVNLKNDLSLALAAHPIRIEAPIPGKSLVGIEIPNSAKTTVGLGSLLKDSEYQTSPKPLLLALGKGVSGKSLFGNLAKMPHLLIAGATGSGKSVTIHTIVNSLLFRNPPENLKFIMVDPKRVELTFYNGIPHLLTPVITDPKRAIRALHWAGKEMEKRYDILETEKVRDIQSYHSTIYEPAVKDLLRKRDKGDAEEIEKAEAALPVRMPYLVFVIDELADIMASYPRELEAGIVRLAQMSRAVGIHLIISTQRPSVNVITGLIKANVPSRIALKVASQIDSRTILDQGGAESLLGSGDMLYMSGEMSKPSRLQSAYISEKEIKDVVKHIISDYRDHLPDEIDLDESMEAIYSQELATSLDVSDSANNMDDRFEEARQVVVETQKASTSFLQRKLGLGYSRAAKIIDQLEEQGVIGPVNGSKSRDIYEKPTIPEDTYDEDVVEEEIEDVR